MTYFFPQWVSTATCDNHKHNETVGLFLERHEKDGFDLDLIYQMLDPVEERWQQIQSTMKIQEDNISQNIH